MDPVQFGCLPLAPIFFLIFVALLVLAYFILRFGMMKYAYEQLGLSPNGAGLLMLASLLGSAINIPITVIPKASVAASKIVSFYAMQYQVPAATDWGGTVLAVNVGGSVIPVAMSLYLLVHWQLWTKGLLATAVVALVCYLSASVVPEVGIAIPVFVPVIAATLAALLFSREQPAPVAYICGSLGTLIGADLMNLPRLAELNAPIASIGGAGTFDGVFVSGIAAVLLASLPSTRPRTAIS